MTRVYLDTETGGFDAYEHDLIEIAWAVDDGPINSAVVPHEWERLTPQALAVNCYLDRGLWDRGKWTGWAEAFIAMEGATLCGSNPGFDERFLLAFQRRNPLHPGSWPDPWKHRKIDLGTYAMAKWRLPEPIGLAAVAERLGVQAPDHTAAGDVHTLRECMKRLEAE